MLRKFLVPLLLSSISSFSFGQSILTDANFNPVLGDAFAVKVVNETGINPGASGAAVTWDFTYLTQKMMDTGHTISRFAANGQSHYDAACNLAIMGPSATSHATTFLVANSSKLSQYGYYINTDTNLILTNPADELRYPFTYGNSFDDTCTGTIWFGISASYTGYLHVQCDAYGTLVLPFRTDTGVLRVHTVQNFTDNVYILGIPVVKNYIISSYDWYKPNYHTALLTIQTITEVGAPSPTNEFAAYAVAKVAGVNDVAHKIAELQLSPNPASGDVTVSYKTIQKEQVRISLMDMAGREVALLSQTETSGAQQMTFNTNRFPKGLYLVRLQVGSEIVSRKLTIQ